MSTVIRGLRLLSIVVWVGGIIFFAFVLAPVAFSLLPSQHLAGTVVGGSLRVLDLIGIVCACLFLLTTFAVFRQAQASARRQYEIQLVLASLMLLATVYIHAGILPAMERDRAAAGGVIENAPATDSARLHFERLHKTSERLEGTVLLLGLGIVFLMASESASVGSKLRA